MSTTLEPEIVDVQSASTPQHTGVADDALAGASSPAVRRVKKIGSYAILCLFAAIYLFPFLISIATSFKTDPESLANPLSLIPSPFTLDAWKALLGISDTAVNIQLFTWARNSVVTTVFITIGRVGLAAMAGYALARLDFPGRKLVFSLILAVMMVPGVVLLIPRFLLLDQLSLRNTYMGMILPLMVDCAAIYLMKQNFEAIPRSVEEAAAIDGASIFRTWWSVVLPMVRPALIAVTILSIQGAWNEFTMFLVATDDPGLKTLTLGLAQVRGGLGSGSQFPITLGAAVMVTLPIIIIFFAFQRYFTGDHMKGSEK
jgi:multiple sugar transport system permease protein